MIAQLDRLYIRTSIKKTWSRLISYFFFEGRPLTTKGQWINPMVFFLFRIEIFFPALRKTKAPVFIIGTGRSGTTVLGLILSMHCDVSYLNEPKALWFSANSCDDLIGSYSRKGAKYRMGKKDATAKVKHTLKHLYGACLFITGGKRLVDKYPEMIFRVDYIRELFSDAKFIFLVRNGMDTISSIASWVDKKGVQTNGEQHDWWGSDDRKWKLLVEQVVRVDPELAVVADDIATFTSQYDRAAVEWVLSMREGLKLLQSRPDDILTIRYENLVDDPENVLVKMLEFCNFAPDQQFMNYAKSKLNPVSTYQDIQLHAAISPFFYKTMKEMNYD